MNRHLITLLALTTLHLNAHRIITTGAPKSGINFLADCICQLINSTKKASIKGDMELTEAQMQRLGRDYDLLVGTPVCNEANVALAHRYNAKVIYIVRNPLDQLASTAQTIHSYRRHVPAAQHKDVGAILMDLIREGADYYRQQYDYTQVNDVHGIADLYALWQGWCDEPNVLVVRYEDLVNDATRARTLQTIANFLGLALNQQRIHDISQHLCGGFFGFFKKKPSIGGWKKVFTPQHVAAFKLVAGDLMQTLAY